MTQKIKRHKEGQLKYFKLLSAGRMAGRHVVWKQQTHWKIPYVGSVLDNKCLSRQNSEVGRIAQR